MAFQDKKFLDAEGITHLVKLLDEYPNNQVLGTVIDAIEGELEQKAEKSEIPEVPVQDVQIAGSSVVGNDGVASIPNATNYSLGVVRAGMGLQMAADGERIATKPATSTQIKTTSASYEPITPAYQHISTFYGLAKAAGDTTQSQSDNTVGTYTPEAKGAIQQMLGVSDLIATAENSLVASRAYAIGDVFTANGKLYKATAAIAADAAIIPAVEGEEIEGANCVEITIADGFVKTTDYVSSTNQTAGIVGVTPLWSGIKFGVNGMAQLNMPADGLIKAGTDNDRAILIAKQHLGVFYGLAKAAGADERDSTLPVGQYTDTAKTAIRAMLGATSSDVIAVQDEQPTSTDTKVWLPETEAQGIEVPTMADLEAGYVKKTDYASASTAGISMADSSVGIGILSDHRLYINAATSDLIKGGSVGNYRPIVPTHQHESVFYGLAKAAGDTTQSASDNAVGTYTDDAKAAIRTMLGAVGTEDYASSTDAGVIKMSTAGDILEIDANGVLKGRKASLTTIKMCSGTSQVLMPSQVNQITFYGLAHAAGDTTQSSSSNAVGTYTDNAKASIKAMLGIQDGSTGTVDVSGATPTIAAVENTRYVCGEVTSLSFTPPSSGISIVRFTSGSTVTVLTIPSTVKFPEWFDPTSLETNTIYEICITDGVYGAVMSWAL